MTSYLECTPLLQYADDTIFFTEGLVEEAKNPSTLFDLFANFSGLYIKHGR